MLSTGFVMAMVLSSISVPVLSSAIDLVGVPTSHLINGPRDLTVRQTDNCPGDSDCDCTDWGADCDVSDWSWIDCTSFPDACTPPPPTPGPITCSPGNQATYKSCWQDIHANSVDECASLSSAQLPNGNMTSTSANHTQVYREGGGSKGVTYMMTIAWIPGCTTYQSLPADNPSGHSGDDTRNYQSLFKDTYYNCTGNSGLGGFVDVGCLRYSFTPNDIKGVFASPPHPELFWNQYPNICG